MKRSEPNIDDVLARILTSTPSEEMETAASRVLRRLQAGDVSLAEQTLPARPYQRPAWKLLVVTASIVALLVSAALAAVFVMRERALIAPAPEGAGALPEVSTTSPKLELPAVPGETSVGETAQAPAPRPQQSAPTAPTTTPRELRFEVASLRAESPQAAAGDEGQPFMDCQGTNGRLRAVGGLAPPLSLWQHFQLSHPTDSRVHVVG